MSSETKLNKHCSCGCNGNFHLPYIRKQYTKVENCTECGHSD